MAQVPMHGGEIHTDPDMVRRLIARQFPQWSGLPINRVDTFGTDNAIYKLGSDLAARLPRIGWATDQADKERRWLPIFASRLPVAVPEQVAMGEPAEGYPYAWSVYRWLPGEPLQPGAGPDSLASDLAAFTRALRKIDTAGAHERPRGARGAPLAELDQVVRSSISASGSRIDAPAALDAWNDALDAPAWDGSEVWVHGDLLPGNLLMRNGTLSSVIDFGCLNVGDPACDLQPAWHAFSAEGRRRFRAEMAADAASWRRGRGWVIFQTTAALAYYWDANPGIVRQSQHALSEVITDASLDH